MCYSRGDAASQRGSVLFLLLTLMCTFDLHVPAVGVHYAPRVASIFPRQNSLRRHGGSRRSHRDGIKEETESIRKVPRALRRCHLHDQSPQSQ